MSNAKTLRELLTNLADVVRSKLNITDKLSILEIGDLLEELAECDGNVYNKYDQLMNKTITQITYQDLCMSDGSKIQDIANYVFNLCKQLKTVVLPNTITSIGKGAFYSCQALKNIYVSDKDGNLISDDNGNPINTFPNGITSIRGAIFRRCYLLPSFVIPNTVTAISGNAFNECWSLTELVIPRGVKTIGEYALRIGEITNKATIYMLPTTPPTISDNSIFDTSTLEKIVVPSGCASKYKSATNWAEFADKIVEEE